MLLHDADIIKDFTDYVMLLFWRGKLISAGFDNNYLIPIKLSNSYQIIINLSIYNQFILDSFIRPIHKIVLKAALFWPRC